MNRRRLLATATMTAFVVGGTLAGAAAANAAPVSLPGTGSISTGSLNLGAEQASTSSITMSISNNTGLDLTLVSADNSYGKWTSQAPATISAGQQNVIVGDSSTNINGSAINLVYSTPTGATVTLSASVPLFGGNNTDTSGTNAAGYTVDHHVGGGFHPTATFNFRAK